MSKDILLKSFTIENFAGIDEGKPVLLYVEEAYANNKNIAIAKGDEGTGKTSWLTALQGLLCVNLGIKEQNFVNQNTKKINAGFEFSYKDSEYRVSWTKSAFKLQKKEFNELSEKVVWKDELSPVATLQKVIGYVGITPMNLKQRDGGKQVEEIRKALNVPPEVEVEERKIMTAFETARQSRTEANRDYEGIKKTLSVNPMYIAWEESEKKFAEKKSTDTSLANLKLLEEAKGNYRIILQRIENVNRNIIIVNDEIEELETRLQSKKLELLKLQDIKTDSEKYIEENKSSVEKYDQAQQEYFEIQKFIVEQSQWEEVKSKKSLMDEFQDAVIKLDGQKDDLKEQLLEVGKKGLPDIEGLEVITSDAIDGLEKGVYLNRRNVYQLSESELWELFLKIWRTQGVRFVFVENISSLGSHAVETLNDLAAKGVKIFGTMMERGGAFTITITDKIE